MGYVPQEEVLLEESTFFRLEELSSLKRGRKGLGKLLFNDYCKCMNEFSYGRGTFSVEII